MVSPSPLRPGSGGSAGTTVGPGAWALGLLAGLLALGGWLRATEGADPASQPAAAREATPGHGLAPGLASGTAPAAGSSAALPAAQVPPEARSVRILALHRDSRGRWLARLQVGEDAPRQAQAGDVVARGLRVERIAVDGITVRRGLQLERLPYAGPVQGEAGGPAAQPAPVPAVIVSPPGLEPPRSSAVERAIERAAHSARWQALQGSGR